MQRRAGGMWFLAAAVAAGLLAALLTVQAIRGREVQVQVYVAAREIPAFAALKPDLFQAGQVPLRLVPADAIRDLHAVEGRFTRTVLLPGEVLREGHLARPGARDAVTARLTEAGQPGARALALPVDPATGVAGTLQPGDRVDVIAAVKLQLNSGQTLQVAKVIARAVPVLHAQPPSNMGGKGVVVLQVTPELAEEIAFAQTAGTVYLESYPLDGDPAAAETRGMTPQRFAEKYGLVVPGRP